MMYSDTGIAGTGGANASGAAVNGGGPGSRTQHPYAAMMYSDFPYRPPPPSYQASMQEYRLRLLLLDRQSGNPATSGPNLPAATVTAEPPPNYRAHVSDHPVIESAAGHATSHQNTVTQQPLSNSNNTTTTSSSTINQNTIASTMS